MARWIGVDLDGTLAEYDGQMGADIGEPVGAMLNRVKNWLTSGQEVRIFTARASEPAQRRAVKAWLKEHGLEACAITNSKDFDMTELWDDKARRVEKNKGRLCKGCKSAGHHGAASGQNLVLSRALSQALTDC
jgi:hypothetical protein